MSPAQAKYLISLCGGVDEALTACGMPKQYSGSNAKKKKLEESLSIAEASKLIDSLKPKPDKEIAKLEREVKDLGRHDWSRPEAYEVKKMGKGWE